MAEWEGIAMRNGEVAAFIRKHGAPIHSKPHGEGKTVLYYPRAGAAEEDAATAAAGFRDMAGTPTPGTRDRVLQRPLAGGTEIGSTIVQRTVRGTVAAPQASPLTPRQNPNRLADEAEVINSEALDAEIQDLEEELIERRIEDENTPATARARKIEQDLDIETPEVGEDEIVTANQTFAEDAGVAPELKDNEKAAGDTGSAKKRSTAKKTTRKTAKKSTRRR